MNLYLTLGLGRDATAGDIKRAYRRLARKFHPELNPGNEEAARRFRQILEAYETLVDPDRRQQYDRGGVRALRPLGEGATSVATFAFAGFDFSTPAEGPSASTFGDLFAEVMREAAASAVAPKGHGADLHGDVHVPFEAAVQGTVAHLTVTRVAVCVSCGGSGRIDTLPQRCAACEGTGLLRGARGHMVFSRPCALCEGTGERRFAACPVCGGDAVAMRTESIAVKVPAGVRDGERLRLAGQGNAGRRGGAPGDLYVTVHVAPHPMFRRDGDDVRLDVPVAIHEAAFGARIDVPSPTGPCRLRIPPGTQSGREFRVRERGIPSARGGRPGDLVVTVRVVLPPLDDEHSRALVRELAASYPDDVRKALNG
jgi:molecular chaperone DnaJ